MYADAGTRHWTYERNVIDLREFFTEHSSWVNPGEGSKDMELDLRHDDNYTTHRNAEIVDAAWEDSRNTHIVPDAQWPPEAQDVVNKSGLQSGFTALRRGFAERVVVSSPDQSAVIVMRTNQTVPLRTSAATARGDKVARLDLTADYVSSHPAVADVASSGRIIARSKGKTEITAYLTSVGIQKTSTFSVYVDDLPVSLQLGIEEAQQTMHLPSQPLSLAPRAITEMGRSVTIEDLAYSVAGSAIVISSAGVVTAQAAGVSRLTVSGRAEGIPISHTFEFVVHPEVVPIEHDPSEWFNSVANWSAVGGVVEVIPGASVVTTPKNLACYTERKYLDELLAFRFHIEVHSAAEGGWPSIAIRALGSQKFVAGGESGYIFVFGSGGLELHRFNGTQRTVIYGSLPGFTALAGPAIVPSPLTFGQEHTLKMGAVTVPGGTRLMLLIDGKSIIDFFDTQANAITTEGFVQFIGVGETYTVKPSAG